MTLDEAIKHCYEYANNLPESECECKKEHIQLAEWLQELKSYRKYKGNMVLDKTSEELKQMADSTGEYIYKAYRLGYSDGVEDALEKGELNEL